MKTTPKKNGGFTLVELIVVIAILAILAAVAIPAYSGYIAKAEKANDLQLLGALNTAFNAACVENNASILDMEGAEFVLTGSEGAKTISGLKLPGGGQATMSNVAFTDAQAAAILQSFDLYYGDNMETPFKVFGKIVFKDGAFEGEEGEATVKVTFNGKEYDIKESSVQNYLASVFYGKEDDLAVEMDTLSTAFGEVAGADLSKVELYFGEEFANYLGEETDATTIGNMTALWVAQKTEGMTAQDAGEALLAAKIALSQPNGSIYDISDDPLSTISIMYGAITAYAKGAGADGAVADKLEAGVTDQNSLLQLVNTAANDPNFLSYIGTVDSDNKLTIGSQFEKDMNGYIGALDAMNSVSGDIDVTTENLWTNSDLAGLLEQLQ